MLKARKLHIRWLISILLGVLGLILLVATLLGDFTPLGNYKNEPPRQWEAFDPASANRNTSLDSLLSTAQQRLEDFDSAPPEVQMIALFDTVTQRFTHSDGARYTIFSNWIMATAGLLNRNVSVIRIPEKMVSGGHSLICSESSYLLLTMAISKGIQARQVGLNGHVVMEAWYEGGWHMFDPDQEVIPRKRDGVIASVEGLSRNQALLAQAYSQPNQKHLIPIIASRVDNTFASYPKGTRFIWKADVLARFEYLAMMLKYALPILLILGSLSLCYLNCRFRSDS